MTTIEFTIKTLEKGDFPMSMDGDSTVKDLKDRVHEMLGTPQNVQRFIFCGQMMRDEGKLSEYNIQGKALHLVFNAPPSERPRSPERPPRLEDWISNRRPGSNPFLITSDDLQPLLNHRDPIEDGATRLAYLREMLVYCNDMVTHLQDVCQFTPEEASLPTPAMLRAAFEHPFVRGDRTGERQIPYLGEIARYTALLGAKLYPFLWWYSNFLVNDLSTLNPDVAHAFQLTTTWIQEAMHMMAHIHHAHSDLLVNLAQPALGVQVGPETQHARRSPQRPAPEPPAAAPTPGQTATNTSANSANSNPQVQLVLPRVVCQIESQGATSIPPDSARAPPETPAPPGQANSQTNSTPEPAANRTRMQTASFVVSRNDMLNNTPEFIQSLIQSLIPSNMRPIRGLVNNPRGPNQPAANQPPNPQHLPAQTPVQIHIPDQQTWGGAQERPASQESAPAPTAPPQEAATAGQGDPQQPSAPEANPSATRPTRRSEGLNRSNAIHRLMVESTLNQMLGNHNDHSGDQEYYDPYLECITNPRIHSPVRGSQRPFQGPHLDPTASGSSPHNRINLAAKLDNWEIFLNDVQAERIGCPLSIMQAGPSNIFRSLWAELAGALSWLDFEQFFFGDVNVAMVRMRPCLQSFLQLQLLKHNIHYDSMLSNLEKEWLFVQFINAIFEQYSEEMVDFQEGLQLNEGCNDFKTSLSLILNTNLPGALKDILDDAWNNETYANNIVNTIKIIFAKIFSVLKKSCVNPKDGVTKFSVCVKQIVDSLSPNLHTIYKLAGNKSNWVIDENIPLKEDKAPSRRERSRAPETYSTSLGSTSWQIPNILGEGSLSGYITVQPTISFSVNSIRPPAAQPAPRTASTTAAPTPPVMQPLSSIINNPANFPNFPHLSRVQLPSRMQPPANPPRMQQPQSTGSNQTATTDTNPQQTTNTNASAKKKASSAFPLDWNPIVTVDSEASESVAQAPFSDAYLSNIPSKKRRLVEQNKPRGTPIQNLEETIRQVVPELPPTAAAVNTRELQGSLLATTRAAIRERLNADPEYNPETYQYTNSFLSPFQ